LKKKRKVATKAVMHVSSFQLIFLSVNEWIFWKRIATEIIQSDKNPTSDSRAAISSPCKANQNFFMFFHQRKTKAKERTKKGHDLSKFSVFFR
jgi:hypothetical protein